MKKLLFTTAFILFSLFTFSQSNGSGLEYKPLPYVAPDNRAMDAYRASLARERAQIEAIIQQANEDDKANTENDVNRYLEIYNSFQKYPDTFYDGWHNVISTNRKNFCADRKVFVFNNTIIKYKIPGTEERVIDISYSLKIKNGIGVVKLNNPGSESLVDVIFLEDIDKFSK